MSVTNRVRSLYFSYLSNPASDRPIHRTIQRHRVRSILECGIGVGHRATRMIEAAGLCVPLDEIRYTGVDRFEDRTAADGPGVTLKMAHRLLRATGARIRLVPGDLPDALARSANSLGDTDLVVLSARHCRASLDRAWFYLPRLLHADSRVFLEEALPGGRMRVRVVEPAEIAERAAAAASRRAA